MFRHILLPIDGSELSTRAASTGIELAALAKARVLVLHVIPPFQTVAFAGVLLTSTEYTYNEQAKANGARYLADAHAMAEAAGVSSEGEAIFSDQPADIIIRIAGERDCDLIVMGSHGRRGMTRLLLGSETQKVLLGCGVPVLVCR
ncbi:universal stress protein [Dyella soli]|uniref:Universal stress protein n=1 Tax=Dyella soli TaxID=522319 RepID=A0A4R0YTR4_9GAMM|nr:universal stress protein [Dyella soli]TCI10263.1 universal stress protein [Dyella soli]